MALPLNNTPIYTLELPSTGKTVRFRPFLVKDQKILMLAQQSSNQRVMADSLKEVIKSCLVDQIDIDSLAVFDIEYLFLHIRGKSVGEEIELTLKCDVDHGEDNEKAKVKKVLKIDDITVETKPGHESKFILFNDVGVQMKYPDFDTIKAFENKKPDDPEVMFRVIAESIDYIYDSNEIYHTKEQSKEEMMQFLENLTSDQFKKIQNFFDTMPKMGHTLDYSCPVCGKHHNIRVEGLDSFF